MIERADGILYLFLISVQGMFGRVSYVWDGPRCPPDPVPQLSVLGAEKRWRRPWSLFNMGPSALVGCGSGKIKHCADRPCPKRVQGVVTETHEAVNAVKLTVEGSAVPIECRGGNSRAVPFEETP
jgi:hypothetical protein